MRTKHLHLSACSMLLATGCLLITSCTSLRLAQLPPQENQSHTQIQITSADPNNEQAAQTAGHITPFDELNLTDQYVDASFHTTPGPDSFVPSQNKVPVENAQANPAVTTESTVHTPSAVQKWLVKQVVKKATKRQLKAEGKSKKDINAQLTQLMIIGIVVASAGLLLLLLSGGVAGLFVLGVLAFVGGLVIILLELLGAV